MPAQCQCQAPSHVILGVAELPQGVIHLPHRRSIPCGLRLLRRGQRPDAPQLRRDLLLPLIYLRDRPNRPFTGQDSACDSLALSTPHKTCRNCQSLSAAQCKAVTQRAEGRL